MLLEILTYDPDNCLPPFLPQKYYIYSLAFASFVGVAGSQSSIGMPRTTKDAFEALSKSRLAKEMTALKQP